MRHSVRNKRGILVAGGTFITTLADVRKAAIRAKSALSGCFAGLLCLLLLPGSLFAGTTLTYVGNPYPPSYGCSGSYVCNGTTPFITFQFHTTLSLSQLSSALTGQ